MSRDIYRSKHADFRRAYRSFRNEKKAFLTGHNKPIQDNLEAKRWPWRALVTLKMEAEAAAWGYELS